MADFSWAPEELKGRLYYKDGRLVASCEVCGATKQTSGKGSVLKQLSLGKVDIFRFCSIHGDFVGAKPSNEDVASWPNGHKRCRRCLAIKPFGQFHRHKDCLFGYAAECKQCRLPKSKAAYAKTTIEYRLWSASKGRAKKFGIPHTITVEDIVIPEYCPILGRPLRPNTKYAPSLDQIVPRLGYIVGNIQVVSKRANLLKNNMTLKEARLMLAHLELVDIG